MGGKGSGNWYRWNTQTTLNDVKQIDIRFMKQQGFLKPGTARNLAMDTRRGA